MRLSTREEAAALRVGDKVTTDFIESESTVVRTVMGIMPAELYGSGVRVSVDGGEPCVHCGRTATPLMGGIDGVWFLKVEQ